jgi:hypothetical protein
MKKSRRLFVEEMERRLCLAFDPTLAGSTLTLDGTGGDDVLSAIYDDGSGGIEFDDDGGMGTRHRGALRQWT